MSHFIYRPKSGDRVFIERPSMDIHVVWWANGCRHVVGGCALGYQTATPGRYWRAAARRMAEQVVSALHSGIAYDDQGTVTLIVPPADAVRADRMMVAACEAAACADVDNGALQRLAAMVAAGWTLADREGTFALGHFAPADCGFDGPATVRREDGKWVVQLPMTGLDGLYCVASAPEAWGAPEVSCGSMTPP